MVGALIKLIEADAGAIRAEGIPPRHAAYVHALAPVLSLAVDDAFTKHFQAALDQLAAKSPPLVAQLNTYRRATGDMLRWRARLAGAQRARAQPTKSAGTSFKGALSSSAPVMFGSLAPELVGNPSIGESLVGTSANQQAVSTIAKNQSCYAVRLDPASAGGKAAVAPHVATVRGFGRALESGSCHGSGARRTGRSRRGGRIG